MTTDTTKPLAKFSWSLNSNTGLSSSGSQDDITPEMYGAIMGVLAGRFPEAEITRLQAQVDALAGALEAADELCKKALPRFNWCASPLDAQAIALLNTVPGKIASALAAAGR